MVIAIAFLYIVDNFFAADIAEVNINIRHGHALRIEETFKEQVVFERVKVSNAQQISYDTTCR